jgi:serine/threonine protein phosphatase PrpC
MEDAALVSVPPRGPTLDASPASPASPPAVAALLAVFDGHRGAGCALHAAATLEAQLSAVVASPAPPPSPGAALAAALAAVDATWRAREAEAATPPCGAAALAALVWGGTLALAHAGDCRAVLGVRSPTDGSVTAVRLTVDHTAADPAEAARVLAAGGSFVVAPDGSRRVAPVGLAVTRSLGDADARAGGVTAEAAVTERVLAPGDAFVVLATDGLWDAASDADVVAWVEATVKHPAMAAKRLATEAVDRGSGDNVAVVVAYLEPVATLERVHF